MSSLVLTGDTSGQVTLAAAAVAGSNTITVQAATGTMSVNTLSTAVASTSGTSIDFTGLPTWCKRVTVMFGNVSTSGTSNWLIQIGSGSITSTGYVSAATTPGATTNSTAGFIVNSNATAANTVNGAIRIELLGSNLYVSSGILTQNTTTQGPYSSGSVTLSGALDRVRITTAGGTDTFDAGTINILYEG